jgi:hypothetical protein
MSENDRSDTELLYIAGGMALMVFGAGLIMSSPAIRKTLLSGLGAASGGGEGGFAGGINAVLPDVERYLKIRAM